MASVISRIGRLALVATLVSVLSGCLVSTRPFSADVGTARPFDVATTLDILNWDSAGKRWKSSGTVTFEPTSGRVGSWRHGYVAINGNDRYAVNFLPILDDRYAVETYMPKESLYYYAMIDLSDRQSVGLWLFAFTDALRGKAPTCMVSAQKCNLRDFSELVDRAKAVEQYSIRPEHTLQAASPAPAKPAEPDLNVSSAPRYRTIFDWSQAGRDVVSVFEGLSPIDGKHRVGSGTDIRSAPLPWRRGGRIVYMWDQAWNEPGLTIYYLLDSQNRVYRLDGGSDKIHLFNSRYPPSFSSPAVAEAYLRFFMSYVHAKSTNRPFLVLNTANNPFLPRNLKQSEFRRLHEIIRPAVCVRRTGGRYACTATVVHGTDVFRSKLTIDPGGTVTMTEDVPVLRNLSVATEMRLR